MYDHDRWMQSQQYRPLSRPTHLQRYEILDALTEEWLNYIHNDTKERAQASASAAFAPRAVVVKLDRPR